MLEKPSLDTKYMSDRFFKLTDHLKLDFNLDALITKFDGDRIDPSGKNGIYADPSGVLHWQYFTGSGARFARNVYRNLKTECESIVHSLQNLQNYIGANSMMHENPMVNEFLNHRISSDRITFIKQAAGLPLKPHIDSNRRLTLNIGLRNSNTGKTYVSDSSDVKNFATSDLQSYTMADGDVYLLKTANAHSVESLVTADSELDRYIVTYAIAIR
jgi:hypothetical protein